jgi:hypothetical protein
MSEKVRGVTRSKKSAADLFENGCRNTCRILPADFLGLILMVFTMVLAL